MTLKNKILIALSVLCLACGTQKQVTQQEVLPPWVQTKIVMSDYYVGLGSAQKTMVVQDYQTSAKNDALADLASEIAVKISTQSVIQQFENSLGVSEDFSSYTKSQADEDLEGYEMVDSYESSTHYYVMYKLSKQKYLEIKQQRKTVAINKGIDFLLKARYSKSLQNYHDAIFNYVKGLESVKKYFTESLECQIEGKNADLGNELVSGFASIINDIQLVPKYTELDGTKGKDITAEQLTFTLQNSAGYIISGLPVIFTLGTRPLRNNKAEADASGSVSYNLMASSLRTGSVYFIAGIDGNTLAANCTQDPLLRKMLRKMKLPESKVLIKVENPRFFIETNEKNMGAEINPKVLRKKMEQLLANNEYPVVYKKENADYILELTTDTQKANKQGRMHYAQLKGEIEIFNTDMQLIYVRPIEEVSGVQLNYNDAGLDAYSNLADYLNRNFLQKLKEVLE